MLKPQALVDLKKNDGGHWLIDVDFQMTLENHGRLSIEIRETRMVDSKYILRDLTHRINNACHNSTVLEPTQFNWAFIIPTAKWKAVVRWFWQKVFDHHRGESYIATCRGEIVTLWVIRGCHMGAISSQISSNLDSLVRLTSRKTTKVSVIGPSWGESNGPPHMGAFNP